MAYPPGAMRPGPPTRPPSRPPSLELPPVPTVWPCGCPYTGPHHNDCMWSLWEEMKANYQQTKTVLEGMQTQTGDAQAQDKCECSCRVTGLQQMLGVTAPWLKPPFNINTAEGKGAGVTGQVVDAGNYTSESRKLIEEQQRIKKSWEQFIYMFDIAMDLANDMSKQDRGEVARLRRELERLERQERREEERRNRQQRRESKCAQERSKGQDEEEGEAEPCQSDDDKKRTKKKSLDKKPEKEKEKEKEQKRESKQESEAKPPPETPQRRSTKEFVVKEEETVAAKEEPEESPQPETTEVTEEVGGAEVEGAEVEGAEVEGAEGREEAQAEQTEE